MKRRILLAMATAALAANAETLKVDLAAPEVIQRRLASGEVKTKERQAAIRSLFAEVGCEAEERPIDKRNGNVICTLPGDTDAMIVVGGHFDFVDIGRGIVDDWTGTSLLPSLYHALKVLPRKHSYQFTAFASEEKGLVGSRRYVKELSAEQRARVRAFVNLECLGLNPPGVWKSRSAPPLIALLLDVAHALNIPLAGVDVDQVGDDDTHPFLKAKIPVLSIHSITQETLPILHSTRDRLEAVNLEHYYAAYKLTAYYLAYLDQKTE